ncbi:(2Fe-2S)-binding protein [Mycolicibacterium duvalii]|uniref:(2Fe-2S)-binding protein n=1 Tax=Mycolicibacterium duvalii TaxID=39688 RepID=A0A7I7K1N0_9MYCO|nr:aromatic ring-hydroxylating dioxygenase subunit alpha [Mycolicibacterium duvalii]MCV7370583.1 aromatic ring-hydroxylating dioxygenase subunit alpha [Mycolicibacterium duvalii]PEG39873.1 (2Fe-2S)-binding protein [Mycolicibacterium duvalii]BBX18036.1 (2Fe-2S)-binding protein [Mycolicibacterium duvalii]
MTVIEDSAQSRSGTVPPRYACGETFVPKSRYVDPEFLRLELDRLFTQVWQPACREEELPAPGSFYEYVIGRQSIMVVRQKDRSVKAFYNACTHRGMKVVRGSGCAAGGDLRCQFHGWRFALDGRSSFVPSRDEFLDRPRDQWSLRPVAVGSWGGWIFVSMADNPPDLLEWLDPLPSALEPFRLHDMRFRWRKRTPLNANYKTVIDAFIEGYHTPGTHPQTLRAAQGPRPPAEPAAPQEFVYAPYTPTLRYRNHSRFIYTARPDSGDRDAARKAQAARPEVFANSMQYNYLEVGSLVTERDYRAARRLATMEPSDIPPFVLYHQMCEELALAEGVDFPKMTMEQYFAGNGDWHVFPTLVLLVEKSCVLGYRVLPDAENPNRCVFEMFSLEHFAPGEVPETSWLEVERWQDHDGWGELPTQDLRNIDAIHAGMHSRGFDGLWLNTAQEMSIRNAHAIADRFLFGVDDGQGAAGDG